MVSIKSKLKNITNNADMKEVIRNILIDNASIWFPILDLNNFETKFLKYYWGESAEAQCREP